MSKNDVKDAAETVAEKTSRKSKAKPRPADKATAKGRTKASAKAPAKAGKAAKAKPDYDFIGKVESLRVKSGAGPDCFEFRLKDRDGKRQSFRFDTADGIAMNAMANLVLAAHASATKLRVRTGAEVNGVAIVRELETGAKSAKG